MTRCLLIVAGACALLCRISPVYAQEPLSLNLAEAKKLCLKNNPGLSAALLDVAASLEVPTEYRAAYLPTLQGSVTGVVSDMGSRLAAGGLNNPVVYNRFATGLSISQLVTDFGRTSQLIDMAKLRADAQQQTAEQERSDILLITGQAYFELLREQAVLRVAKKTVAARQYLADQVAALARNNLKTELDVSFANVNLGNAKLLQVQAENSYRAAQARLAAVLGLPGDTTFALVEEPLPAPVPTQIDPLIQQALQQRPELKQLHLEQSASETFVRAEHALNYPSIGILGTAGLVPAGQPQVPDRYGAIGFNINVPIFNGGLFKARENEARLRAEAAAKRLRDTEIQISLAVRTACLEEKTAFDRLELSEQIFKQAQIAFDFALSRYNLGLSSIVELSQAQLNLTSAQIDTASAKYEYQSKQLGVDYQTGALN
jgi:outer membrane protein